MSAVPDPRNPLEQALDLMVFVPIGLAITVVEEFPELAQKGRQRIEQRAATAKLVGQFAVAAGRRKLQAQTAAPRTARPTTAVTGEPDLSPPVARRTQASPPVAPTAAEPLPNSEELGIPGYDSLSASQVVQRLPSLLHSELDAVRAYESATRGRRTILTRISQLQT